MPVNANILIEPKGELHIHIQQQDLQDMARAYIVTHNGELVDNICLNEGENIINITPYLSKNYAVKVVNGKNVTVQKI